MLEYGCNLASEGLELDEWEDVLAADIENLDGVVCSCNESNCNDPRGKFIAVRTTYFGFNSYTVVQNHSVTRLTLLSYND